MTEAVKPVTGYAPVENGQLYYEVAGEGYPLVLIHAGIANSRMWDAQFEAFTQRYRVIRYDTRGFGQTRTEETSYSNRQDLYDLLNHLGVEKAYVLGLSRGGQIAIDFTLEHPEMVAALIPVAAGFSGFDFDTPATELQKFIEMEALEESGDTEKLEQMELDVWVDGFHRSPGTVDKAVLDFVKEMNATNYHRPEPAATARPLDPPAAGRLAEIQVTTLVIVGDIDTSGTLAMAEAMVQGIKGAKKVVFPGVAHMVNLEKPEEFNQTVLDFLSKI